MSAAKNRVHPLVGSLTSRRAKSLLRAEDVARELRHQLAYCRGRDELDTARLAKWMRVTGNVKYIRPNAGTVPQRDSDVGTSPLAAVSESGDKA